MQGIANSLSQCSPVPLYSVKLATRGAAIRSFDSEDEVLRMAFDVVSGLSSLHEGGYLDGDVRFPNVVQIPTSEEYVLIDFEHGGRDLSTVRRRNTRTHDYDTKSRCYFKDHEMLRDWDAGTLDDGVYTMRLELY